MGWFPLVASSGGSFQTETTAWENAVIAATGSVSAPVKSAVDAFIVGAKADSVWAGLDRFGLLGTNEFHGSLIDIKDPTKTVTNHSGTFSAGHGYTGDGSTAYLDTGFVPSTASGSYALNSAMYLCYLTNSRTTPASMAAMGAGDTATTIFDYILPLWSGTSFYAELNNNSNINNSSGVTDVQGVWLSSRTSSGQMDLYKDSSGTPIATSSSSTSVGLADNSVLLLASRGPAPQSFSTDSVGIYAIGGGLSSANAVKLMTRVQTLATALGL